MSSLMFPAHAEIGSGVVPAEKIIDEARNARPFILVDAEDRENEGDVIIPAQFATPDRINFMAMHARGLICLALEPSRAARLGLTPMTSTNTAPHKTAFATSIEAREGVTTGISAPDRARTIAVAIDHDSGPEDIVSPGHVFPLIARDGGVLVRAGHTEAAVDVARLAGLIPAGVICEIMNDDGSMARLPELVEFGARHGMKIGTIASLIAYRRRSERHVDRILDMPFESDFAGSVRLIAYRNRLDGIEHLALVKGRVDPQRATLVRMHRLHLPVDLLGQTGAPHDQVRLALQAMKEHDGAAVTVLIREPDPRAVTGRLVEDTPASSEQVALRDYGIGAQILLDLRVRQMILITTSLARLAALEGYDLHIVERRTL